jgi:hypothetical protein
VSQNAICVLKTSFCGGFFVFFSLLVFPITKRLASPTKGEIVMKSRKEHTLQIVHTPFRQLAMMSILVVIFGLAWRSSGLARAQSLAPQATTITITQWLGFPNDPGAKQSSQSPFNAQWSVAVGITTSDGKYLPGRSGGTLTFFYDGNVNGTFRNAGGSGPYILSMPAEGTGDHLFQATYSGDSTYATSSAQATHIITKANVGLTIDSASTFTYAPSAPLKLLVRSQVGIPAGEVLRFLINDSPVYSFTILGTGDASVFAINQDNNSVVPVNVPSVAGTYRLSITYGGDTNIVAGSSPTYQVRVTATGASTPAPSNTDHATPTPTIGSHPGAPTTSPPPIGNATPSPIVATASTPPSTGNPSGAFWWWILGVFGLGGIGSLGMVWRTKLHRGK